MPPKTHHFRVEKMAQLHHMAFTWYCNHSDRMEKTLALQVVLYAIYYLYFRVKKLSNCKSFVLFAGYN